MEEQNYYSLKEARVAMLMTLEQLSKRTNKATSTLSELEKREISGKVSIQNLKEVAASLGYEFNYEFVPKKPIKDILLAQAIKQVRNELGKKQYQYTDDDIKNDAITLLSQSRNLKW